MNAARTTGERASQRGWRRQRAGVAASNERNEPEVEVEQ
jgi:hypothetical protein